MGNGSDNKRIAKNSLFLYFRSFIVLLVSLYTSRVVLQSLGVEDYGIYNIVGGVVSMFSIISGTLATATQRFITFSLGDGKDGDVRTVFSNGVVLHIVLGVVIGFLLEIIGIWLLNKGLNLPQGRLDAAEVVFHFSVATFVVGVISVPYNALIVAYERLSAFAVIGVFECVCKLFIAFAITWTGTDKLIFYAFLQFLLSIIIRFIYVWFCRRNFAESRRVSYRINRNLFRKMFSFAGWNLFGQGALVLRNQGVDIVLNVFFGVVVNAAKGVSNLVQTAVSQFVSNFQTAVKPQLTKAIAVKDFNRAYQLIIEGSRFSFYLLTLFTVPIIVNSESILDLWLIDVPEYAVAFVQLTMLFLLCTTQSQFLIHSIMSTGNIRNYQIAVGFTKMLAIPFVYVVFVFGGSPIMGVVVNIFLEVVCIGIRLFFNKREIDLPVRLYLRCAFIRCYAVFMVALVMSYLFYFFVSDSMFFCLPFSFFVSVFIVWFLGVSRAERECVGGKVISIVRVFVKRVRG